MINMRTSQVVFVLTSLLGGLPQVGHGTTFVPMDELTLLRSSEVVLVGTVTAIESAPSGPEGAIRTYIHVQPERVIKGAIGGQPIVLRELGGTVGDRTEWVFGAPEFWVGERDLLFLSRNDDGTVQTNSLSMGKFTLGVDSAGHTTAVRDYGYGSSILVPSTGEMTEAQPETQEFEPFFERLRTLSRGLPAGPRPGLRLTPSELSAVPTQFQEAYTFLGSPPARWFEPDSGLPVSYLIDSTGDSTLGATASRAAIDAALAAWTDVPTASLVLADGGATAPGPFNQCSISRIIFNDPYNEVTDPSGCSGALAIGGFCSGGGTTVVNGTTFSRIAVGKVTFNNGWGACYFWNQCNVAEVATHEIGHTIGLGHSSDSSATMAATAHFDGRCAGLRSDDMNGVSFIYPQSSAVPSPTPTRAATNTPRPTVPPTAKPTTAVGTPVLTRTPTATSVSGSTNDSCTGATTVSTTPFSDSALTTSATTAASDPYPGCGNLSRAKSVWYQFTPPANGRITADTFGSDYDTILSAFSGSCGTFSPVSEGCNDDAGYSVQSQVSFNATAGVSYYFMVTSYSGVGGTLSFHLTFQGSGVTATATTARSVTPTLTRTPTGTPAVPTATFTRAAATVIPTLTRTPAPTATASTQFQNDTCASATVVSSLPYSGGELTGDATTDASDPYPSCGNRNRSKSVWYRFTASGSGLLTANTSGSNYDTILSVYTGSCAALSPLTCNDDYGGVTSQVSYTTVAGTTYYFLVTSYTGAGGTLIFNLR